MPRERTRRPAATSLLAGLLLAASLSGAAAAVPLAPAPAASSASASVSASASASAAPRAAPDPDAIAVPTGRPLLPPRARPSQADAPIVACSWAEDVCVHAAKGTHPAATLKTLRDAERALVAYRAMGLPAPLLDGDRGGGPAFDLYLQEGAALPATAIDLGPTGGALDRASAFSVLRPPRAGAGCAPASEVARAMAHALLVGLDAGLAEGTLAMTTSYLASLAAPCPVLELAAIDDAQRTPERAITAGRAGDMDGHLLFPQYLDDAWGTGRPGHVMLSLIAVAGQRTTPGAWHWENDPDVFDALRVTLRDRGQSLGDLLLDYAIDRAFVGSRSDGQHLTDVARFGDLGKVRFDWSIPFDTLPRRLAPLYPPSATGAVYVWLDLAALKGSADVTFAFDWELPVLFRWAIVKVDEAGAESARVIVPGIEGDTHAQRTVVGLKNLAGLLLVGVNLGGTGPGDPFDPDEEPFEPHACSITIVP